MAGHIYSEQQAQSTTRKQVFATADSVWRHTTDDKPIRVAIKNADASIVQYLGDSAVTTSNGFALAAGQTVTFDISHYKDLLDLYCVAASGTPSLHIFVVGVQGS